jgi:hypothetical protein
MSKINVIRIFTLLFFSVNCLNATAQTLSDDAYELANKIFNSAQTVTYEHKHRPAREQIVFYDNNSCSAKTDCSGFISYVLDKVAHKHYQSIKDQEPQTPYPQAKTYAKFFSELDPNIPYKGWIGIRNVFDLKRGDIIAWEKGSAKHKHSAHGNSGHVMMVIDPPKALDQNTVSINVLDSSSVYHFKPESLPPNANQNYRDGVGKGYIRLLLDDQNKPIAYWEGVYWGEGHKSISQPSYSRIIAFGRMVHLSN